ncbi:leucyl aminopeptidase [Candidatus Gottesmanbacteria bacterium]|nr:leucyl aminopeptidase [Candidatus Gottesmanbacteria bacterium]
MKFLLKPTNPEKLEVDVLIKYCWEGEFSNVASLPKAFLDELKTLAEKEEFKGKESQTLFVYPKGDLAAYKFFLFGIGKKEEFDIYKLYKLIATSIKRVIDTKPAKIALIVDDYWMKKYPVERVIQSVVEAVNLSSYKFIKYKGEEEQKNNRPIEEVLLSLSAPKLTLGEEGMRKGEIFSNSTVFARDLINEPPEITSPSYLADVALNIAKESKNTVKVKIMDKDEIAKLGMNSFLGVASGSDKPPKFIHLSYKPAGSSKKIVLIGKGITFDTGGLSLKSAEHMETMKLDMAGAAAILAVFHAITLLNPIIEVVGLIAACENMPSGKALKPGDILKAMNGKTIEVLNTDAEGRLTLADAISYANLKEKPDEIIDLATLTGACMVALGDDIAGMWGNNTKLIDSISKSGENVGEWVWNMPLFSDYKSLIKSHIADVKNIQTGRYGGAITAALFLAEFVGDTPWVHLDIAGPAFAERDTPLSSIGGVGFGVRTLLEYILGNL